MSKKLDTSKVTPVSFYFQLAQQHKLALVAVFCLTLLGEVLVTYGTRVLGYVIDAAQVTPLTDADFARVGWLLLLYVVGLRFGPILMIRIRSMLMHLVSKTLRTQSFQQLFEYLSRHSATYYANRFAGSVSSDVNTVAQNMVRLNFFAFDGLLGGLFQILATLILLITIDSRLALFFAGGIIILVPINYLLSKRAKRLSANSIASLAKLRGRVVDSISNVLAVQQFARREYELGEMDTYVNDYQEKAIKTDIYTEKVLLFNNFLVAIVFLGSLSYVSFLLWRSEVLSLGDFIAVVTLLSALLRTLTHVGMLINNFATMYGETAKALEHIYVPHEIIDASNASKLQVTGGAISFNNVSFTYEEETIVFEELNLSIEPGQKVGVVGPSGGGKTTFVKLLLRQYEPQEGTITIDNQEIETVTLDSLRESIGVVPQEPLLFHRSVAQNIAYGNPSATESEIITAAKQAHVDEFIKDLPAEYQTLVGERGVKLSGGQRQRIAIARVMLKNAPILVLDEATSALDSESEALIQSAFHTLMSGKTVIAIAHRLSTLQEMDRIIVFENGKVVQDGSHEKLLKAKKGLYARLWDRQAGGFMRDDTYKYLKSSK